MKKRGNYLGMARVAQGASRNRRARKRFWWWFGVRMLKILGFVFVCWLVGWFEWILISQVTRRECDCLMPFPTVTSNSLNLTFSPKPLISPKFTAPVSYPPLFSQFPTFDTTKQSVAPSLLLFLTSEPVDSFCCHVSQILPFVFTATLTSMSVGNGPFSP